MTSSILPRLLGLSSAAHFADQLTLATILLGAAQFGAGAGLTGMLVAAQSAAWLLVSLPAGALIDRLSRRRLISSGAALAAIGSAFGALGFAADGIAPLLLAAATLVAASGVVTIVLSIFALLPTAVAPAQLPRANAAIELSRAVVTLAAPLVAGALVATGAPGLALAAAALSGLAACRLSAGLPKDQPPSMPSASLTLAIKDGAAFVANQPILRAIAACAIAWNSAFYATTALFVPFAAETLGLDSAATGLVWSAYGAGLILGAVSAPMIVPRLRLGRILLFGPGVSVAGALLLATASAGNGVVPAAAAFGLFGFGPMLWLIVQTSLRQAITPPHLLGRVGAVVQVAIYGVRPVGALTAGVAASVLGVQSAMWFPVALFALSFVAISWSSAPRLRVIPAAA
jgi:predicted MFS family arabinose efflux permease